MSYHYVPSLYAGYSVYIKNTVNKKKTIDSTYITTSLLLSTRFCYHSYFYSVVVIVIEVKIIYVSKTRPPWPSIAELYPTVNATVVGSIPSGGNELFVFPRSLGYKIRCSVEYRSSTSNASDIDGVSGMSVLTLGYLCLQYTACWIQRGAKKKEKMFDDVAIIAMVVGSL